MGITSPPLDKRYKGIFIFGEDPVGLAIKPDKVRNFFKDVEFTAVCDLFHTETAKLADVVLPAVSFAEVDGSSVNMMGKVQNIKRAIPPLTGFTNLQLLKMLNKDAKTGKIKDKFSNFSSLPPLKIKSNADGFENKVRERLKELGVIPSEEKTSDIGM